MNFKYNNQFANGKLIPAISLMLLLTFFIFLAGCNYYKVTNASSTAPSISKMQMDQKYFIIHHGTHVWHLDKVSMNEDKTEITGAIEALPDDHLYYLTAKTDRANKFKRNKENPTYEVHIYISEYVEGQNNYIAVPLTSIKKMEVYDLDKVATGSSHAAAIVGITLTVATTIGMIVLLTTSCPLVYTSDGSSDHFVGELFGGAIFSSLERNDYLPLPEFSPANGEYQLKICNELLERQYTNLADLVAVEHPVDSKVIMDKNGNIQTILNPESPVNAFSDKDIDYSNDILSKDSCIFLFGDCNITNEDLSNLTLSFKKPIHAHTGKLILHAKNSYWLDYIFGKFNEQIGVYYNTYAEMQKLVSEKKAIQWSLNQGIPLSVYVETEKGWKFVDYFNVIGPMASRDLIMPVDVSTIKGELVKIKLVCGFMFWEIDYAAMDFSENIRVNITHIAPTSALDEKGNDVSSLIASIDHKYLVQPEVGNEVILKYAAHTPEKGKVKTFFLHSRGYYEYIRDYKGKPELNYLLSFKNKGAFTSFAKQHFGNLNGDNHSIELVLNSPDGN